MSTQSNFHLFPFALYDDSADLPADLGEVETLSPEWDEMPADLGYSDDSISAKATWEACNDIRRALQSAFGRKFETFSEIQE